MDSLAQTADAKAVATEYLKQWAMGSNARRALQPKAEFAGPAERNYNLKNKRLRKFLQYEHQTFGINLGWTDDAEPATGGTSLHPPPSTGAATRSTSSSGRTPSHASALPADADELIQTRSNPMMGDIHGYLARVLVDDRLQASERHRALAPGGRPVRPEPASREAHALQRALVRASLLTARRGNAPTAGRSA
jgi:hypothetical protein